MCPHSYMEYEASMHDSNEIPTATPMFFGSGNMERLVVILSDGLVCRTSKMVVINRKYIWDNGISQPVLMIETNFQRLLPHFRGPATQCN